jgi:hypothetical protein
MFGKVGQTKMTDRLFVKCFLRLPHIQASVPGISHYAKYSTAGFQQLLDTFPCRLFMDLHRIQSFVPANAGIIGSTPSPGVSAFRPLDFARP